MVKLVLLIISGQIEITIKFIICLFFHDVRTVESQ